MVDALAKEEEGLFRQCKYCAVVVSQTKVGVCLQFEYDTEFGPAYLSVDLIPLFNIIEMKAIKLPMRKVLDFGTP